MDGERGDLVLLRVNLGKITFIGWTAGIKRALMGDDHLASK